MFAAVEVGCSDAFVRWIWSVLPCLVTACSAPTPWAVDAAPTLAQAQARGADVVVFFALPGRQLSDQMEQESLNAPEVLDALRAQGFYSLRLDGFSRQRLYDHYIGGGEGMGVCVLDEQGRVYAARPGPQDPPELAAYLRLVASRRAAVAAARVVLDSQPEDPVANYELGVLLLELGCRVGTDKLLLTAAQGGVVDAHHRLARLYALDGRLTQARQWLRTAHPTPAAAVTEGYVLYKERRHRESAELLGATLEQGGLSRDDELRAQLFYGKALHQAGADQRATQVLQALVARAPGTTYAGAALHTLDHIQNPNHGHSH